MSEVISIRLAEDLLERLAWESEEKNLSLSELVRAKILQSYEEKDSVVLASALKEQISVVHNDVLSTNKILFNVVDLLNAYKKEKEEADKQNKQWHAKNGESISALNGRILTEFLKLNDLIDHEICLFKEAHPRTNPDEKHSWVNTLNNLCATPGFYFIHWLMIVLLISFGLSFHFTGAYWSQAFVSMESFWNIFKSCMNVFVYVFATMALIYPLIVHFIMKHLARNGWRCEIRFKKS